MKTWQTLGIGILIGSVATGVIFLSLFTKKPADFTYISPTYSPTISIDSTSMPEQVRTNINTASVAELDTLPGIGEEKAKAIIDFREKNGKFVSIEDLLYVPGIGQSLFDQIKELITVD